MSNIPHDHKWDSVQADAIMITIHFALKFMENEDKKVSY